MKAILATTEQGGMGYQGKLPNWNVPGDLQRFKRLTENRTIVMGSRTFFSLPESKRPLPKRRNIVITRNPNDPKFDGYRESCEIKTLEDFLRDFKDTIHEFIVIGGSSLFDALYPYIYMVDLTIVKGDYPCDVYFNKCNELFTWTIDHYEEDEHCVRYSFYRTSTFPTVES